jgi:IS5 family transposase
MQHCYSLSDPAMEDALYELESMRRFVGVSLSEGNMPDESTILHFRQIIERHGLGERLFEVVDRYLEEKGLLLRQWSIVDASIIQAPSSTKNKSKSKDSGMHSTKKGQNSYFGMKVHIGVDVDSGLVHSVQTTAANAHDVTQAHQLVHGKEKHIFADSGYRGADKREEVKGITCVNWDITMGPGKRRTLDTENPIDRLIEKRESIKSRIRAKVEHPFRIIKIQFGFTKARYKGLAKNNNQLHTLFTLANLYLKRKILCQAIG